MRALAIIVAVAALGFSPGAAFAKPNKDRGEGGEARGRNGGRDVPDFFQDRGGDRDREDDRPRKPRGQGGGGGGGNRDRGGQGAGQRQVPFDGVVSQINRRSPGGRLLTANTENWGGRPVYRVKWASADGRRVEYIVDAQTGAILREEN